MQEMYIRGHKVKYEDDVREGVNYLDNHLDENESKVFFDEAKLRKMAEFEDYHQWNYTLTYEENDGSYTLVKRPNN